MKKSKVIVNFVFDDDKYEKILELFLTLPEKLRPDRWGMGERGVYKPITDRESFINEMSKSRMGPFMRGSTGVLHSIDRGGQSADGKPYFLKVTSFVTAKPEEIEDLFNHFIVAKPYFAYACAWEEFEERNQIKVQLDSMTSVETFTGEDARKHLPGLYWLTFISNEMLDNNPFDVVAIDKVALTHAKLDDGSLFYRFYEHPEQWKDTEDVGSLLSEMSNAFHIQDVRRAAMKAKTYQELRAILNES